MSRDEYHRTAAVDLLTLILCLPFCAWLGWWGLLPPFAIGTAINAMCSRKRPSHPTKDE